MGEFAYFVDRAFWFLTFGILVVSFFYRGDRSSTIALAIWVTANLLMDLVAPALMSFSASHGDLGRSAWYLTWSVIELLSVYVIYKLHSYYQLPAGKLARYISLCLLVLCGLQVARYADRMLLSTNLLVDVYKYGVVAINISVFPMAVIWIARVIAKAKKGFAL